MLGTAHTYNNSQGYDETLVTFLNFKSHILEYYIPSNYVRRAKKALDAFKMGFRLATEYIDDFKKHLVNYRDM